MTKALYITHAAGFAEKAKTTSTYLNAPILDGATSPEPDAFILHIDHNGLFLKQHNSAFTPLTIDPNSAQFAWRQKTFGKNQPLAKAIGIKKGYLPTVLDATAGLGRDALLIASLGCDITLLERNPILFLMLQGALDLPIHHANAIEWLPNQPEKFDVIYLDPMFPASKKSALVKKDLQVLQQLLGKDEDGDQLLNTALQFATKRVVVKRSPYAPTLSTLKPSFEIKSKAVRFDIYLI